MSSFTENLKPGLGDAQTLHGKRASATGRAQFCRSGANVATVVIRFAYHAVTKPVHITN